jgi:hypothetical protein
MCSISRTTHCYIVKIHCRDPFRVGSTPQVGIFDAQLLWRVVGVLCSLRGMIEETEHRYGVGFVGADCDSAMVSLWAV